MDLRQRLDKLANHLINNRLVRMTFEQLKDICRSLFPNTSWLSIHSMIRYMDAKTCFTQKKQNRVGMRGAVIVDFGTKNILYTLAHSDLKRPVGLTVPQLVELLREKPALQIEPGVISRVDLFYHLLNITGATSSATVNRYINELICADAIRPIPMPVKKEPQSNNDTQEKKEPKPKHNDLSKQTFIQTPLLTTKVTVKKADEKDMIKDIRENIYLIRDKLLERPKPKRNGEKERKEVRGGLMNAQEMLSRILRCVPTIPEIIRALSKVFGIDRFTIKWLRVRPATTFK